MQQKKVEWGNTDMVAQFKMRKEYLLWKLHNYVLKNT